MKPHLYRKHRQWWCRGRWLTVMGVSPADAFARCVRAEAAFLAICPNVRAAA